MFKIQQSLPSLSSVQDKLMGQTKMFEETDGPASAIYFNAGNGGIMYLTKYRCQPAVLRGVLRKRI